MAREKHNEENTGEAKGLFITFEGCEASGKTTQVDLLKEHLASIGREVVVTREPGGTVIGEQIRQILLEPANAGMDAMTEALLFAADRVQQIKDVIVPALQKGCIVLGDRFVDSSLAYQGVGRGLGMEAVKNLNEWVTGDLQPELTFYLDISFHDAMERIPEGKTDRIEQEPEVFHENIRYAYKMLARLYSLRMVVLDACASQQDTHSRVVEEVTKLL